MAPTVTVVSNQVQNEAGMTATVVDGASSWGSVTYGPYVSVAVNLAPTGVPSFTKYASRYTAAGPNLPEWHFDVADNHTPAVGVILRGRISRQVGASFVALTSWLTATTVTGAGYNRSLTLSSAVHEDIGELGGTYLLEYYADDTYANLSATASVDWNQTVLAPPVRQRLGGPCAASSDTQCAQHYGLSNSYCVGATCYGANTAATAIAGSGLPGGKLRIANGYIDNPTSVPVRVKLAASSPTTYTRGLVWTHPQTANPGGVVLGCNNGIGDQLLDGTCYAPGTATESLTTGASAGDIFAGVEVTLFGGGALSTCSGCSAYEYEIPATSTAIIWVQSNPLSFLLPTTATEIVTVGTTSLNVTGTIRDEWLDCIASINPPDEPPYCTDQVKKRAVNYLTRVTVNPTTTVSLQSRPASSSATLATAIGTNVTGFGFSNSTWTNVETGW
jgi:hypothetical protein